jgi:hypothetical protein
LEETTTNMACRITFSDEQERVILATSDLRSLVENCPVKYGQSFLFAGKLLTLNLGEYEIESFEINYATVMATDPLSFEDHSGRYNLFNIDIIVLVKSV